MMKTYSWTLDYIKTLSASDFYTLNACINQEISDKNKEIKKANRKAKMNKRGRR